MYTKMDLIVLIELTVHNKKIAVNSPKSSLTVHNKKIAVLFRNSHFFAVNSPKSSLTVHNKKIDKIFHL